MTYRITTNNRQRTLVPLSTVPETGRHWFDYVDAGDEDCPRFFRAYGVWFDYNEIERAPHDLLAQGWQGFTNISIGACYVFRYFDVDGYELDGPVVGFATYD